MDYPAIDPVAVALGPLVIHWYGLMYVVGFLSAWWLGRWRADYLGLSKDDISDLIFYGAVGVIVGGRLGYALFYGMEQWSSDPLWVLQVWDGGMSFHGGLVGVIAAALFFARKKRMAFIDIADFVALLVPIGLGAGRLGNFINQELPGRVTDVPWALIFPQLGPEPRHPSALYEMLLEGVVLFVVLFWLSRRPRQRGLLSGAFLFGYGVFRFAVEFVRMPDAHLGFIAFDWVTMGHALTLPMIVGGLGLMLWSRYQPAANVKEVTQ
ncbi:MULTISPECIES: prolipoprotein diacylglyceryl transferase [Halomonadaceae]|uniref:Phosphatidylglycerol--prolipoprotein diacylglyceryl transferase n=1 Tax=Vreelandella piezotolerans TaxID=2609667 RepID=A0ABQ6XD77_9GAMM|nr:MULTISPECIES: prolipoprotein diacylglyceryl transferase [Halomonas]KAE8439435.1 prolipoprotein diacylglyceryl transferase [Halomonas piezotolerans]MCG7590129.1 prolipoprotein diacylglyceryl transferase [Halomonas sp. McD50-5]MCG7615821.1 prolipoprotein diacylglyceryl transferase [Halomonas sp. McD50-4]QJA25046.1 prolipoprotein diacylglyceryl transferase [Halomonas piezotolerans]